MDVVQFGTNNVNFCVLVICCSLFFWDCHTDIWYSIQFFDYCRKRLFSMINDLPTVYEVVSERKQGRDKSGVDSGSKSKPSTKVRYSEVFTLVFIPSLWFWCVASCPEIKWRSDKEQLQTIRRGLWRGRRWAQRNSLWNLRWQLQRERVLDWVWYMWEVVPWEVCEDNSGQGREHQALQVPQLQR